MGELGAFLRIDRDDQRERDPRERARDFREFVTPVEDAELSRQQEAPYTSPWSTSDAPENYLAMLARGIVGLKLAITRLEGKAKMSQNREARDRAGVVAGLSERAECQDAATAALVAKLMV